MRIAIVAGAVLAIGGLTAVPAAGQQFFTAIINASLEVPPNASPGTGLGCLTFNANGTLTYIIAYSGLVAPEVAAHIHGPAAPGVLEHIVDSGGVLQEKPVVERILVVGVVVGVFRREEVKKGEGVRIVTDPARPREVEIAVAARVQVHAPFLVR